MSDHGHSHSDHGHSHGGGEHEEHEEHPHHHDEGTPKIQIFCFIFVGILTLVYSITELIFASIFNSLALLSDGFHNLSDVISLFIAFYALTIKGKAMTEQMSYGWARSEILGGLINGSFLLSLCLYISLEAIPKFISVEVYNNTDLIIYIAIAASGVAINTIGTLIFLFSGTHGHSHAGGGDHGHSHGGDDKKKKKKKKAHDHDHKHGEHEHEHKHKQENVSLLDDNDHDDHSGHGHSHGDKKKEKKEDHHGHSHGDEEKKEKKPLMNVNTYAMLIHYFGDALSSVLVLVSGLLMFFFPHSTWAPYVDPVASLFIVAIMLWTTIPLLIRCSKVLLQSVPNDIEIGKIKNQLLAVPGVLGVHELHVWPLVEEMVICSVHITCEEGSDFNAVSKEFKHIFHQHGIHSTSVQPEFVPIHHQMTEFCEQNCVEDCEEDWCCRKSAAQTVVKKSPIVPKNNDEFL